MNPTWSAVAGIAFIFLSTCLGSALVFLFRSKSIPPWLNQIFLGFAAGVMLSASIFSLILPALEDKSATYMPAWSITGLGVFLGALFLWGIDKLVPHLHQNGEEEGLENKGMGRNFKMFLAVTIHNVPEGLSVGIAFGIALAAWNGDPAAALAGAAMLALGIGIQNIPEGAVVSLMYKGETGKSGKSFLYGALSGAVEPLAAVLGLFLAAGVQSLMPWALSFAAGCMLYVIAEEMIPEMKSDSTHHYGVWAFILGFILMMGLDVALG